MGACGGKTCTSLILRIFREEGIEFDEIKENVKRPLFVEVPLGIFAGKEGGEAGPQYPTMMSLSSVPVAWVCRQPCTSHAPD